MPGEDFATAVLPHLDRAYALARWLMRDATAAEDVVQDALVRALRYFPTHRGEHTRAWLLSIVRRVALDTTAKRRPDDAEALEGLSDPGPTPEQEFLRGEARTRVDRAIAALPAELRDCLVLRELEELSYREIAEITGVPVGTVMSRLWRARQALRVLGSEP